MKLSNRAENVLRQLNLDDPYYYLYFGNVPRPPSYFTLEALGGTVGRVIRFDSFSKILSSGFRLGYVTGPKKLVDLINAQVDSLYSAERL